MLYILGQDFLDTQVKGRTISLLVAQRCNNEQKRDYITWLYRITQYYMQIQIYIDNLLQACFFQRCGNKQKREIISHSYTALPNIIRRYKYIQSVFCGLFSQRCDNEQKREYITWLYRIAQYYLQIQIYIDNLLRARFHRPATMNRKEVISHRNTVLPNIICRYKYIQATFCGPGFIDIQQRKKKFSDQKNCLYRMIQNEWYTYITKAVL